jgi:hypothetical protein
MDHENMPLELIQNRNHQRFFNQTKIYAWTFLQSMNMNQLPRLNVCELKNLSIPNSFASEKKRDNQEIWTKNKWIISKSCN